MFRPALPKVKSLGVLKAEGRHPLLRGLLGRVKRSARDVRAVRIGLHRGVVDFIRAADVAAYDGSKRRARLDGQYAPHLPALDQVVEARILELAGGRSKGHGPKVSQGQPLGKVEIRHRLFRRHIIGVLREVGIA